MGNVTEEKWIEMLEKKSDGNYIVKYPKVKSKSGVTFDEHLADDMHIPKGLISMWSGSIEAIPTGWALCNGENGTPDLQDRFIVGAGNDYAVGSTGGEKEVTLTTAQIPRHRHSSGTLSAESAGSHTHGSGTLSAGTAGSHSHGSGTLGTVSVGGHTHSITISSGGGHSHTIYFGIKPGVATGADVFGPGTNTTATTESAGDHSHSGSIGSGGSHSHTISGTTSSAGTHSHTISGYTGYIGSGEAHENRPPYFALAFIMKT